MNQSKDESIPLRLYIESLFLFNDEMANAPMMQLENDKNVEKVAE